MILSDAVTIDQCYAACMTASAPLGRPLKFESVQELETQINLYFDDCDKTEDTRVWSHDEIIVDDNDKHVCTNCWQGHKTKGCLLVSGRERLHRPYTVTGLALWLGTSRQTLLNYEGRADFIDTIADAKLRVENYAAERLFDPHAPTRGVIFSLSNNSRDWVEKNATELTIPKDSAAALASRIFDEVDEVEETATDETVEDQPPTEAHTEKTDLASNETQAVSKDE